MKSKLHIAIVTNVFPQLSETFIFRKVMALAAKGHQVTVIAHSLGDWDKFQEYLPAPATLSVRTLPQFGWRKKELTGFAWRFMRTAITNPRRMWRLVRQALVHSRGLGAPGHNIVRCLPFLNMNVDVLHCEFLGLGALYPLLGNVLEVRTIVSCRGADLHLLEQYPPRKRAIYLESLRMFSAIHCVSNEMKQEVERLALRRTAIWVNRPAVDVHNIATKDSYETQDSPLIVSVGRAVWKKGFDYLLNALHLVSKRGIPFRAKIIGGGPLLDKLRMAARQLEIDDYVEFAGAMRPAEVLAILKSADIFVLSSHEEGISNAVLEAMATGLPIVTTNVGGMTEAVHHGVHGLVTPPRDFHALASELQTLLTDSSLRQKLGTAARRQIEENFTLQRQIDGFEAIYQTLT